MVKVLITSAGGMTGEAVTEACVAWGLQVRAVVSSSRRAEQLENLGAEVVIVDLRDPRRLSGCVADVDTIYAIWPNFDPDEYVGMRNLIDACDGERRFVLHSVLRPHVEAMPHHWAKMRVEEYLYTAIRDFRVLQPSIYADNIQRWLPQIHAHGSVTLPWGIAPQMSYVDLRDVAEAAVALLTHDEHQGGTFEACGPEALDGVGLAQCLQQVLGLDVSVIAGSPPQKTPAETYAESCWRLMLEYYAENGFAGSPTALQSLLSSRPRPLSQWVPRRA